MTTFWSFYISIMTIGFLILMLLFILFTRKGDQRQLNQVLDHSFDGIQEHDNPLPKWWLYLFIISIVFSIIYLLLYPGLGNFKGLLPGYEYVDVDKKTAFKSGETGWTSAHEWEKEVFESDLRYNQIYAKYRDLKPEDIIKQPEAISIGERLFSNNCAICHASDAKGSYGFPNLTDTSWRWGGDFEAIKTTITHGRTGIMAAHLQIIGDDGVKNVSSYVVKELMNRPLSTTDGVDFENGKQIFSSICFACHGADGKGNQLLGAPDLTNPSALIYGTNIEAVQNTIRNGRTGIMPAQKVYLSDDKINILAAYVYSLSKRD